MNTEIIQDIERDLEVLEELKDTISDSENQSIQKPKKPRSEKQIIARKKKTKEKSIFDKNNQCNRNKSTCTDEFFRIH